MVARAFERREEFVVDEFDELIAGDAFGVLCPIPPAKAALKRGAIVGNREFPFLLFVVKDFEEEKPANLADALSIAVNADILPHDVLNDLDECRSDIEASLVELGAVERLFKFVDCLLVLRESAEGLNELNGRS